MNGEELLPRTYPRTFPATCVPGFADVTPYMLTTQVMTRGTRHVLTQ